MIRKLTVSDNEEVMALLKPEATLNLFIIGDIENFGYESDVQDLWGEFDSEDKLHALLLRFDTFFLPYSKDANFGAKAFSEIIAEFPVLSSTIILSDSWPHITLFNFFN